ncbi:sigma-54 dependent transcriptional regulator [Pseudodesulfovibrio sp.]|uniref:sigma-54-dependent transcriptional regulator n=1 Tax=Pseudodesulfovibrio sp. TaxID=2035812 RepID=UPI0026082DAE|nr:sigma-54 dependent transcriptional regulator [Pseudodesulfovibrio sp.]MDD3310736.1 sigma-54 dependent transcriptional regulator [Pseudodesulfovibrio sp.]
MKERREKNPRTFNILPTWLAARLGLRGKLLLTLLPSLTVILLVTGYASYKVSEGFINIAIERSVTMHTMAVAHEMEQFLENCRKDLLFFAQGPMQGALLREQFARRVASGSIPYLELCYVPSSGGQPVILVRRGDAIGELSPEGHDRINPTPFGELDRLESLKPGEVSLSDIMEITYPMPDEHSSNLQVKSHVIRFYTPIPGDGNKPEGLLFLSVEATQLRNILSLYTSDDSPMWGFPRSNELRFTYFFNQEGWILFQSEALKNPDGALTTYLARDNFNGTLGKAGHGAAFRPNTDHLRYWEAVKAINQGKHGIRIVPAERMGNSVVDSFYFSYAPVNFRGGKDVDPTTFGGVVFVDRSQLPVVAGYKNMDVMFFVTLGAAVLVSLLVYLFGRVFTKPIRVLADRMAKLDSLEEMEEIHLPYSGFDVNRLQKSINNIIRKVKEQVREIEVRDEAILNVNNRERASLRRERAVLAEAEVSRIPEIIGQGPAISSMKVNILKAAQTGVDVLISGETGTGKQLVAEAIHHHSSRAEGPFVSINCGALDENLLLDALFGHVKGAFSDAKDDRNGAFVEADNGTLFLDEIQSASPKVQQSLLRAIATRKIKPLGSDREQTVDVRIVAATNVDLPSLIEDKTFREDLYYRLKVVSISTPPLRQHRENITLLAVYYLQQAEQLAGRSNLGLSKGALAKLTTYDWPGNVRELVNSITRAAIMAETDTIQAEEIRLENEFDLPRVAPQPSGFAPQRQPDVPDAAEAEETGENADADFSPDAPLNERQKAAWPAILRNGKVTRKEYQDMVGGSLPTRTAIYDLQDFVKRGLLVKRGKGPSTRYEVAVS